MKNAFVLLAVLGLTILVLSACGAPASGTGTTRPTPPAAYASKTNPVAGNADAIAKGKEAIHHALPGLSWGDWPG